MRGGNVHLVAAHTALFETTPDTPQLSIRPLITPVAWLDRQQMTSEIDYVEGNLDRLIVTGAKFHVSLFSVNDPAEGVYLYIYTFIAFVIIPYTDDGTLEPGLWPPSVLPNLFQRDWGHREYNPAWTGDQPSDTYTASPTRVLHRRFFMWSAGDGNELRGEVNQRDFYVRLPRFVIPRNSALWYLVGTGNSHASYNPTIAHQVAGTFGYLPPRRR